MEIRKERENVLTIILLSKQLTSQRLLASGLAATSLLNGRILMWDPGEGDLEISKQATPSLALCNAKLQGRPHLR